MNLFDKLCAALAFVLGIPLLILGVIGLFAGCSANFSLPPVLGVIPGLIGWGILRAVFIAWKCGIRPTDSQDPGPPGTVESISG